MLRGTRPSVASTPSRATRDTDDDDGQALAMGGAFVEELRVRVLVITPYSARWLR